MPVSGGDAEQVTRNGGYVAFESFDGRHVYYTQTPVGPSTLWRIPTAGGDPTRVLEGVSERAFEVLEQGIYYVERLGAGARWIGVSSPVTILWGRMTGRGFDSSSSRPPNPQCWRSLGNASGTASPFLPTDERSSSRRLDNPSSDLMMVENFR